MRWIGGQTQPVVREKENHDQDRSEPCKPKSLKEIQAAALEYRYA
jgi:hypothetical protein